MIQNTLSDTIEYIKDLTGLTNASDAKIVRAINYAADDYSRIQIFSGGKWKKQSSNHTDLSKASTTVTGSVVSLETEVIALEYVDYYRDGKWVRLNPTDQRDNNQPLDSIHSSGDYATEYDYDDHNLYFYPGFSSATSVRISYKRAHPRFDPTDLTVGMGVTPIDDEFLALGGATRLTIGSNDPSHVSIRNMYETMRLEIKDSIPKQDQNTPQRIKSNIPSVFMHRSRGKRY